MTGNDVIKAVKPEQSSKAVGHEPKKANMLKKKEKKKKKKNSIEVRVIAELLILGPIRLISLWVCQ